MYLPKNLNQTPTREARFLRSFWYQIRRLWQDFLSFNTHCITYILVRVSDQMNAITLVGSLYIKSKCYKRHLPKNLNQSPTTEARFLSSFWNQIRQLWSDIPSFIRHCNTYILVQVTDQRNAPTFIGSLYIESMCYKRHLPKNLN